MSEDGSTALDFSCACQKVHGTIHVPASSLPLRMNLCHCNMCRRQTGLLAASYISFPKKHTVLKITGHVTGYKASENIIRYFCSTCGSNVYLDEIMFDETTLCSGVLSSSSSVANPEVKHHIFVNDTKDGGMTAWLPSIQGWGGYSGQSQQVDCSDLLTTAANHHDNNPQTATTTTTTTPEQQQLLLQSYCQCRSIQFKITRPNEKSTQLHAPFSDLLNPYISSDPNEIANGDDIKWWLRSQGTKYLAGNCACNSCRLNSGFDFQPWAFIPKANLLDMHNEQLQIENMPHLAEYNSSERIHRHFCSKCGATVFWRSDARPDLIDVSVGLLDAKEGARAESWLEWCTDRISFQEEASNKGLVEGVGRGLSVWGESRRGK